MAGKDVNPLKLKDFHMSHWPHLYGLCAGEVAKLSEGTDTEDIDLQGYDEIIAQIKKEMTMKKSPKTEDGKEIYGYYGYLDYDQKNYPGEELFYAVFRKNVKWVEVLLKNSEMKKYVNTFHGEISLSGDGGRLNPVILSVLHHEWFCTNQEGKVTYDFIRKSIPDVDGCCFRVPLGTNLAILKLLHNAGGDLSLANTFDYGEQDKDGKTMEEKFKPNADGTVPKCCTKKYFTPLMAAACSGSYDCLEYILQNTNDDVNAENMETNNWKKIDNAFSYSKKRMQQVGGRATKGCHGRDKNFELKSEFYAFEMLEKMEKCLKFNDDKPWKEEPGKSLIESMHLEFRKMAACHDLIIENGGTAPLRPKMKGGCCSIM
eukprot:g1828.t1